MNPSSEQVSLKSFLLSLGAYVQELRRHWLLLCFLFLAGAALGFAYAAWQKVGYPAELSFMVREQNNGNLAGLGSVLGQLGMLNPGSSQENPFKALELARSRSILQGVFLQKGKLNGQSDFWGNHLIRTYGLSKKWADDPLLAQFSFQPKNANSPASNKAIQKLCRFLTLGSNAPLRVSHDKKSGIFRIQVNTPAEDLSINLANLLYASLSEFYIRQSVSQSQQTVENLQARADSLRTQMSGRERTAARSQDRKLGLLTQEDRLPQVRASRDASMLGLMYAEVLKNLEAATFMLKNATPVFVEIDRPIAPLEPLESGKLKWAILGGIAAAFVGKLVLLLRKFLRDALA
jgi:uncharacterized protein involved in exopolysaccharide biosynthesis